MSGWQRTLWITATAQVMTILGFSFVTPFLPLYIQQLGVHGAANITLWAAILSGGVAVTMVISSPIWGVLADRHGRKIMVVRAAFSAAIVIGLQGLAQNVWQLLLLRMLQGAFTGTVTASQTLVASQAPRERLGFSLGVMQTAVYLGNSMGPLVGGLLADWLGFRMSFGAATVVFIIAGVMVTLFVREEARFAEAQEKPETTFLGGMAEALRTPAILPMIGAIFAVQFALTVVFPVLPQFIQVLQGAAGHVATATGLVLTAAGISGAISSLAAGAMAERIGYKRIIVWASLAAAIFSVPQFFVTATWQLVVLRVLIGLAMGAVMPAVTALIATLVAPEKRGTVYGVMGSATSLGFAAGPMTAAAVVAFTGIRSVFLTAAVLLGGIAWWVATMIEVPDTSALEEAEEGREAIRPSA